MTNKIDPKIANYIDKNKNIKSFGSIINSLANDDSIFKPDTSHLKLQGLNSIVQELKNSHIKSSTKESHNDSLPSKTHKISSKLHSN